MTHLKGIEQTEKTIDYYELRLKETIRIYREELGRELINQNTDKIKMLVEGYKKFPEHNHSLVGAVETFVLNL